MLCWKCLMQRAYAGTFDLSSSVPDGELATLHCKVSKVNSFLKKFLYSQKTVKRHRKDINTRWLFLVFLSFWVVFFASWAQKPKNTRKSHRKLMSFPCVFGLNFEDKRVIENSSILYGMSFYVCIGTVCDFIASNHCMTASQTLEVLES